MKIKSVKISGFRAFEKEEDSTFDFTKNGEIMNFASIYAPNGFGKTSFYDAVEWGITHKIQRFDKMLDFDKIRKENDGPLLLNKSSLNGKVVVETSSKNFENLINKKKVYKYNEKPVNEYFQNQILTQDLIDAFLKEEKADKRYDNFLEIDESLKKYDLAYKKINTLILYINDHRKDLIKNKIIEQEKLQVEIDFEQEFKKFDEINDLIRSLKKEKENVSEIDQHTFNKTHYDNLSRNTDVRLLQLEDELTKAKHRISTIMLARDGEVSEDDKFSGGVSSYIDNKEKLSEFNEQLVLLNQIVKSFEDQERLTNELSLTNDDLANHQNRVKQVVEIERKFETFFNIENEVILLNKDIENYKVTLLNNEREKLNIEKENNETNIKLNELKKSLEASQSQLNNLPAQQKQQQTALQSIVELETVIDNLSISIDIEQDKKTNTSKILEDFKYFESKIDDDIEVLLDFVLFQEYKELVRNYIIRRKNLEKLEDNEKEIKRKLDSQHKFNNEINSLIKTGLEIVNSSQSSDCPLCKHSYESFEKLSENILSNDLLNSQLKKLLEEKVDLELKVNQLVLRLSIDKENILAIFSAIKQPYLLEFKNQQNLIDKIELERRSNLDNLVNFRSILNNINLSFGESKTFEELSLKFQNEINHFINQISELSDHKANIEKLLLEKESLIKSYKENLEISERDLKRHLSIEDYIFVREYFVKELNSTNFEKSILSELISNIHIKINDLIGKKKNQEKEMNDLRIILSNYVLGKEEYLKRIQQLNDSKTLILRIFEKYENFILSEFGLLISDKDKSQIEKEFLGLIEIQKEIQILCESKIEKYKILKILNDACIKATESKLVQDEIDKITKELQELGSSEEILKIERDSLKAYLKETIESYFYTPLINAIYSKIDPHPDYKSIEFKCDFAETKPRLQIYTLSHDGVLSVPSLYFSTAQINILSLSIFLARALKTKDNEGKPVDCIFIDDPIQSMDSINILSFIDLFKGITLSLDKQLIVSTHEENFHLLLKKKIPDELFKSKFLEFETFGKLKIV